MTIDDTTGFRQFAKNLEIKLNTYDIVEDGQLLFHQKAQLKGLVQAEKEFKKALIAHKWGKSVYQDFVTFICEERRNILAARPFFRERQTTFTAHIATALKKKNDKALYQFSFNWTFIDWVLHNKNWSPNCKIRKLAREISRRRNELLEQNLPLAISQSRIFWNSVPKSHLTYMDIVQIHCQALLLAIDKFCPPNEKEMTEQEALDAYQSFRAVAIGIMRRDRVNHYSETSIHFYPDDRAILYRANKHMRTHGSAEGIDWERLAQTINVDFGTKKTNPQQLIGLVSASSTVSADFVVDPEGESILDAAVSSECPEETIESNNSKRVMHEAISKLTLRERKILIMKGISNV